MWYIIVAVWLSGKTVAVYQLPNLFVDHIGCVNHAVELTQHWRGRDKRTTFGFRCTRYFEA